MTPSLASDEITPVMPRNLTGLLILLLFLAGLPSSSSAQRPVRLEKKLAADSMVFDLKVEPKDTLEVGKTFKAKIKARSIRPEGAPEWHMYSSTMDPDAGPTPLSVSIPPELQNVYKIVKLREIANVKSEFDENFDAVTKAIYGDFEIEVTVKISELTKPGKTPFALHINYMTCKETLCLPERTFDIPMSILGKKPLMVDIQPTRMPMDAGSTQPEETSTAAVPPAEPVKPSSPSTETPAPSSSGTVRSEADVVGLAQDSIWEFLIAAAGFGLLALLTPCVFPMVPITVSFFTKRNHGSRKAAVMDASLYGLGIIVTFVGLGFLLAIVAGSAGINEFAANPWVNMLVATIFIAFALNLFGLFEIGVPSSVLTSLNTTAQQSKNKVASVLLMGFVFSLTSFTCTVPFVGTLMVAFSKGDWFVPLVGMSVFAFVFALPFFLLALFPSLMKAMPRSGGWLNSVKVVMGFLEIAAAMKFLSNADLIWQWEILNRDLVLAAWIAIAIVVTVYLLGRFRLSHDTPVEHIGAVRVLLAVLFLSMGVYLYTGLHGRPLGQLDAFLPPAEYASFGREVSGTANLATAGLAKPVEDKWHERFNEALAEAKRTNKNVFVDFTGYTCTNCRAMESTVFTRPDVKEMFKDFVLARLYTDNGTPLNDSNRVMEETRFNTIALPYYVIISPDDKPLAEFPGFTRDVESFKSFLAAHRKPAATEVAIAGMN